MRKLFLFFAVAIFSVETAVLAQPELHTAKQLYADARLANIDGRGRFVFQHAEQSLSLPVDQLVRWSSGQSTTPGAAAALADGSWLAGSLQWPMDRRVRVVSKWFEAVELDLDALRAIIVNPSPSWPETQLLQAQMLAATGPQDVLWKRDSQSASGIVTVQIKPSIDATGPDRAIWSFKAASTAVAVEVPTNDVAGVTFSPILRRAIVPAATCFQLRLVDGACLMVKEFKRREDGRVELGLASGLKLTSLDEADQFVQSLAQITVQPSNLVWLSELEPARYRLLDSDSRVPWPLGRNRDLLGKRLFDKNGQTMEHALVIHSPAQAAYRWDGKAARLVSTVEILRQTESDSPTPPLGSAQCQVLVGRDGQLVKVWQSETLRAGQRPLMVDVEISRAQLIVLLVDQADMGTLGDHVLWRDVRVVTE